MAKSKFINLLPQEEFDASVIGRVLRWAMGTFRIIVIVTELVVMGAFLSRFWLDAKNSDLNDLIEIRSAEVSAQSDFEEEFRNLQTQLKIFEQIDKESKTSNTLGKVTSKVPPDVSLSSLSFQQDSAQIKGASGSELGIAQFISNLDADGFFKSAELGQVNSSESNLSLTIFTVSISY